jgi:hypothetical protein
VIYASNEHEGGEPTMAKRQPSEILKARLRAHPKERKTKKTAK